MPRGKFPPVSSRVFHPLSSRVIRDQEIDLVLQFFPIFIIITRERRTDLSDRIVVRDKDGYNR